MKIGAIIKNLRKTNRLAQQDLAQLCGVSHSAVSLWEQDRTFPNKTNLDQLANIFGVKIEVANGQAVVTRSEGVTPIKLAEATAKLSDPTVEKQSSSQVHTANRVWIELPVPSSEEQAAQIQAQINAMLDKLGDRQGWGFWWNTKHQMWEWAGPMGGSLLPDNGHWFNLNYLSKGA